MIILNLLNCLGCTALALLLQLVGRARADHASSVYSFILIFLFLANSVYFYTIFNYITYCNHNYLSEFLQIQTNNLRGSNPKETREVCISSLSIIGRIMIMRYY
jgi:hypothetical protein